MSLEQKNKVVSPLLWEPTATAEMLWQRSLFLKAIRAFFDERKVMEVDVPLLYSGVATDPGLEAFAVSCGDPSDPVIRYLQTSPEFPMKRLLAAGCGPIYYLGKAFRKGERGSRHNPEFTMLEWYRPGWDHWQLMNEVEQFLTKLVSSQKSERYSYLDIFKAVFGLHPHLATSEELEDVAISKGWTTPGALVLDHSGWLDLLFTYGIEPDLGHHAPTVIYDFPAAQASLAKVREVKEGALAYSVAERFEFYYGSMELANGYHELECAHEQRLRFAEDAKKREKLGLPILPMDHALIEALEKGFPPCAGVALGVDRLFMIKHSQQNIAKVIPFAWEHA